MGSFHRKAEPLMRLEELPEDIQLWRATGKTTAKHTVHLYRDCQYFRRNYPMGVTHREKMAHKKPINVRKTSFVTAEIMGLQPCNVCIERGGLVEEG